MWLKNFEAIIPMIVLYSIYDYSNPSINIISIYNVKFFVPSNFSLRRHPFYVVFFLEPTVM